LIIFTLGGVSFPNNSVNTSAIVGTNGSGDNVLLNNGTFSKINNNVITDNTIALTKLSGLVSTNAIANVVLDNGSIGKVSNNVITDNTVSGLKITDTTITLAKINNNGGTGTNVILDNNTFGKVNNNVITDNTINGSKV